MPPEPDPGGPSESALVGATGHGWQHWLAALDDAGAARMSHGDIVEHLERAHPEVVSGWWRQSIAVGYERARGRRMVGQTADGHFQIGVRRTITGSPEEIWDLLVARPELWLGPGAAPPAPGGAYRSGAFGEVAAAHGEFRVVTHPLRLRMTWHPDGWEAPAVLQITLMRAGPLRTTLGAHMERLPDAAVRERMREHWRAVLADIEAALSG